MNRAGQAPTLLLPFHPAKVDRRSTEVNAKSTTDLLAAMEPSEDMGDDRHKRSPPDDMEEDVTEEFRALVRETLELNDRRNRLHQLSKDSPRYLISNRAELAEAVGTDKTMINKIIGPARPTTTVKLVERSAFLGRIRRALQLPAMLLVPIPENRVEFARRIAAMSDKEFAIYDESQKKKN